MPTGQLRACVRIIGCKAITSAVLPLAFLLYFFMPYNKQLNNLDVTRKSQNAAYRIDLSLRFSHNDLTRAY